MDKIGFGVKKLIWNNVLAIAVAVFCFAIFSFILGFESGNLIFGLALLCIYAIIIYSTGWNFGRLDSRMTVPKNEHEKPQFLHREEPSVRLERVITASLIAAIPALILLMLRLIAPYIFGDAAITIATNPRELVIGYITALDEPTMFTMVGIYYEQTTITIVTIFDLVYRVWMLPGLLFFNNLSTYGIPILIIPIFTVLGYLTGCKRFSMVEKIYPKIIYKREKRD
ncbi:MAG: hypothetical protein FWE04_06580 [Oscillospiraceae bacterium]|nr:hypothetical protein [Oscillospiraceae bacterium]